jgi:hypothetical protein
VHRETHAHTHIDRIILKNYRVHPTVWVSNRTNNTIRCHIKKHLVFFISHSRLIDFY